MIQELMEIRNHFKNRILLRDDLESFDLLVYEIIGRYYFHLLDHLWKLDLSNKKDYSDKNEPEDPKQKAYLELIRNDTLRKYFREMVEFQSKILKEKQRTISSLYKSFDVKNPLFPYFRSRLFNI